MATERDPDFRLIARAGEIRWCHKLEMQPGDENLTELDDAAYEAAVCRTVGIFRFAPMHLRTGAAA